MGPSRPQLVLETSELFFGRPAGVERCQIGASPARGATEQPAERGDLQRVPARFWRLKNRLVIEYVTLFCVAVRSAPDACLLSGCRVLNARERATSGDSAVC